MAGSLSSVRASATRWRSPLGQAAAEVVRAVHQVNSLQCVLDPRAGLAQTVETGEVLQVLGHGQAPVKTGRLGHDGDASADVRPVLRVERDPRHGSCARGAAISVPSVRTVVALPAPFGPRNPNTSP
jgi:hypothetical protein